MIFAGQRRVSPPRVAAAATVVSILSVGAAAQNVGPSPANGCSVTKPPAAAQLDPFYKKYCLATGIPIASSGNVPDAALSMAAEIITNMLAGMSLVRNKLIEANIRVAIIAQREVTSDIPEHKPLARTHPENYLDQRTRGISMGAGANPVTSVGEENLLCYATDRYRGENILVHEFGHTIKLLGIQGMEPTFRIRVQHAYDRAKIAGLGASTYAMSNPEEYWAEGVQSYFDANLYADPPNGIHNAINTRAKLKDYDPRLFELIDRAFNGGAWRPRCPP